MGWNCSRKSFVWSGRRDSNPRRPAWEYDCHLTIKTIAFLSISFCRKKLPSFHSERRENA
jgi:hypothetical protein